MTSTSFSELSKKMQLTLQGLSAPEEPQEKAGKDGDPQLSALCQMLTQLGLPENKAIVDFGSGAGILPYYLSKLWPKDSATPEYWAVDLENNLDVLSLPPRIHNNSKKYPLEIFYENILPNESDSIGIIVIRNVIHELDINQTAILFSKLLQNIDSSTIIYIQDMERLNKAERGNVGWEKDLLENSLQEIGITTHSFSLSSYSGTNWFAISCRITTPSPSIDVKSVFSNHRLKQLENIESKLKKVSEDYTNTDELVLLQHEYTSLTMQLRDSGSLKPPHLQSGDLADINVFTLEPDEDRYEYTISAEESISSKCGLISILSAKNLLDFPKLISSACSNIEFGGYSNRSLFIHEENKEALKRAIHRGCEVKVMVVDPNSEAANLRSQEPVYEDKKKLQNDISRTIDLGTQFHHELGSHLSQSTENNSFQLRASSRVPRWSYFIVDDTCYLSFYSITLTGSSAPCFVFRSFANSIGNYFHNVRKEFTHLFEEACPVC